MKKLISLFVLLFFVACSQPHPTHVHAYRQQDASGDWIWYYLIYSNMLNSSCPCYSYSSPIPVTNFQTVNFQRVETAPIDVKTAESQPEIEVPTEQMPAEVQAETEAWSENFDANDGQEHGGASEGFDESPASESGGSESGSSDGGGGDGGGGGGGGE